MNAVDDPYAPTAPYYDLLSASFWDALEPALGAALAGTGAAVGPILDLGAGTGRSTLVIADSVPDTDVWAVEPSASMRAMLLGHIALRPDLHDRVTVVSSDVAGLDWPARVAAIVACNMIGHLDETTRLALWARLAVHLAPGGVAVVGLQPPDRPQRLAPTVMSAVRVGELTYAGTAEAVPTGERSVHWTMTYRTRRGDEILDEVVNTFDWWTISRHDVEVEAAAAGLSVSAGDADLLVLRHR